MAGSASKSYSQYFDVFINHRGPDVKDTFATALYSSLTASHGLRVFLDRPEMQVGHDITSQIKAAIEVASVHIAIFSPRYADSKWCLDELVLMVKSGAPIIPVFYNVKPEDLRWTEREKKGPYAIALRKREENQRHDIQTIQEWRNALLNVANISGLELEAFNGGVVELLDKVVQNVVKMVPKTQFNVADHPTGLDGKFKDFERKLLSQQEERREARVVGIIGSGGIGKTTLAKQIFNSKRSEYGGSSFLCDVREKASVKSLNILQSNLINDLLHLNIKINSPDQGIETLKRYLSDFRALIVLDDIDSIDQLKAFLPIKHVLDPRSLILVTSRDSHVLECAKIEKPSIYPLTGLNMSHSKELFCWHAFSQPHPLPGFGNLVDKFLGACSGLPLALKVWGAFLCEREVPYWEDQLKGLHQLPREIEKSLQISYGSLNDQEKQIFLDIACFSIGKNKDTWIRIWGESGWNGVVGFQNLINKCLVEVDGENKIKMHDHFRDLGRNISSKSIPRRLWAATIRDVYDLLKQPSEVRGIRMAPRSSRGDSCDEGLFRSTSEIPFNKSSGQYELSGIKKLQLLEAEGDFVESILTRVQLPSLIWLFWNDCPCLSLPSCIPGQGLKVLEVAGRSLKKIWQSNSRKAELQLQELNIDAPFSEFPKPLGQLKNLEKIVVECSMDEGTHLTTLPEELCCLCSLKHLKLKRCSKLQTIPESLGKLTNLLHIDLSECKSLRMLPDSFEDLSNLQHINLSKCKSLLMLPEWLGYLSKLQHIDLSKCESLEKLPISLGNLTNLQHMDLSGCKNLRNLPISLENLTNLEQLDLSGCSSLVELPISLWNLINIRHIDMSGCKSLRSLPDSWWNLTSLHHIDLSGCRSLERLPDSIGNLTNLNYINMCNCESLKKLPDFNPNLTNIIKINLYGCKNLKMLPKSIENLKNLQRIDLSDCERLESLPDSFVKLTNIEHIDFLQCSSLMMIPGSFGELTKLQQIHFRRCYSLKTLPDSFGSLTNLQHLDLHECYSLEKLPDSFGSLTSLKHINLSSCTSLKMLPDSFGSLPSIKHINLSSCTSLKMLPNSFGNLLQLKHLNLSGCWTLTISGQQLKTVAELYLSTNLKQLPSDVVCLSKLELLQLEGPLLEGLPHSLDRLTSLKELILIQCKALQCVPNSVGLLSQLKVLEITDCGGIQSLPQDLLKLNNLERLEVCSCPLRQLPFRNCHFEGERETMEQRASSGRGMRELKVLHLDRIEISELSFPRGVCPALQQLSIVDCKEIVEIGPLPKTLTSLVLRQCGTLRKMKGLSFVPILEKLDMRGCINIKVEELPELEALEGLTTLKVFRAPFDTYKGQDEDVRGRETLTSIVRARRRWCNCCTEGVLPFFRQFERMAML